MAIPGYTVSFYDIQREFGGNDPIAISEYWRDPSTIVENSSYVKTKSPYGDHPNTTNIATYQNTIDLAQFRGAYSLLGFNRYLTNVYGYSLHFYTSNPGGEFLNDPNYYNLEGSPNYFYVHGGPVFPNTTALYRFFNNSEGNGGPHLFTTSQSEGSNAGFSYEGIVGYVYTYQAPNTQPIYRGTSSFGDFLYSTSSSEITNATDYNINNGGNPVFYVYLSTNWW